MKETDYIRSLLRKHILGDLSTQESEALNEWANDKVERQEYLRNLKQNLNVDFPFFESVYDGDEKEVKKRMLRYIKKETNAGVFFRSNRQIRYLGAIAASIAFLITVGLFFYFQKDEKYELAKVTSIKVGGDRAFLRLTNGKVIDLGSSHEGIVVGEKDIKFVGSESTSLIALDEVQKLELSTPKGGQYQILMSDGTKVWLNAASSIKYPSRFVGSVREVELSGEAYFEVAKNTDKPFIVVSKGQTIQVLGTAFNLLAYQEDGVVKTTLLEGLVAVKKEGRKESVKLYPGEEAMLSRNLALTKYKADVSMAVAWKNGSFSFKDTNFETMIRQISRWYDIDIVFKSTVPTELFTGEMSRKVDLSVIMSFLKGSGINTELKGRILFVE